MQSQVSGGGSPGNAWNAQAANAKHAHTHCHLGEIQWQQAVLEGNGRQGRQNVTWQAVSVSYLLFPHLSHFLGRKNKHNRAGFLFSSQVSRW